MLLGKGRTATKFCTVIRLRERIVFTGCITSPVQTSSVLTKFFVSSCALSAGTTAGTQTHTETDGHNTRRTCNRTTRHTIQNRVSLANPVYWSMVDRTLNMRQISTIINLHNTTFTAISDSGVIRCFLSMLCDSNLHLSCMTVQSTQPLNRYTF